MEVIASTGIDWNDVILLAVAILTVTNTVLAKRNHSIVKEVNTAVNQTEPGAPTLREAVEEVKDKVTTPDPTTPSIGQTVEEIAHSLESSTARETAREPDPKGTK